jgi:hypothetical protein
MANYTKREQNRTELILGLEAGLASPKFPMPTCACGAPARWASHMKDGNRYYSTEHLPPDMREMIASSPLYAGRDLSDAITV